MSGELGEVEDEEFFNLDDGGQCDVIRWIASCQ